MPHDPSIMTLETRGQRRSRIWFLCYLIFVALYSIAFAVVMARGNSPYLIGDWLINYSGGFVRRGLVGTLVLALNHVTHVPLRWVVFPIQAGAFLLLLVCVYQLSRGIRWTFLMTAIMVSPATIAFTVLESYAGFRKETLLFAALAFVFCAIVSGRWRDWQMSALLAVVAVGLVLSHEALAVGMPYFVAALLIQTGDAQKTLRLCILPAILGGVALIAVMLHPGNPAITQAVCNSVGGHLVPFPIVSNDICNGAIQWLNVSLAQARVWTLPVIRENHLARLYFILAFPVFIPPLAQLVVLYRRDGLRREIWIIAASGSISFVGTAFLFYSALDWGRWVHMQAMCLMLILMVVDRRGTPVESWKKTSFVQRNRWLHLAATAAVFLYATTWTLPSIGVDGEKNGYIDNVHMFRHLVPTPVSGQKNGTKVGT